MDKLTTYKFYTDSYYGEAIDKAAFSKWLSKATDKFLFFTGKNMTEEKRVEFDLQIQKAVCALADVLFLLDQAEKRAVSNVKSMVSGSESITYADSNNIYTKALESQNMQKRLMYETLAEYLADTGLLYAGD